MILGGLSFLSPWLLLALAGLPILWWLLRLTPPAPRRQSFPAIRLLFDLVPPEETPQRTPPWLIALRLLLLLRDFLLPGRVAAEKGFGDVGHVSNPPQPRRDSRRGQSGPPRSRPV